MICKHAATWAFCDVTVPVDAPAQDTVASELAHHWAFVRVRRGTAPLRCGAARYASLTGPAAVRFEIIACTHFFVTACKCAEQTPA